MKTHLRIVCSYEVLNYSDSEIELGRSFHMEKRYVDLMAAEIGCKNILKKCFPWIRESEYKKLTYGGKNVYVYLDAAGTPIIGVVAFVEGKEKRMGVKH